MARGLIVKLKDGSSTSVVKRPACDFAKDAVEAKAMAVTTGLPSARMKALANVARRHRIDRADFKPTACGAHVIRRAQLTTVMEAQAQAATLRKDPDVEWVIVNEVLHPASVNAAPSFVGNTVVANDAYYGNQTWLHEWDQAGALGGVGNIASAWSWMAGRPLTPVVVAVLDSGIVKTPELAGRLVTPGYDFVSNSQYSADGDGRDSDPTDPGYDPNNPGCNEKYEVWHGLSVISMLASRTGNGGDINGSFGAGILAPFPDDSGGGVLPVRVGGMCGALTQDIIEGMLWAAGVNYAGSPAINAHPARVINISYGVDAPCDDVTANNPTNLAWLYRQTIDMLRNLNNGHGVLVVASAGNGDADTLIGSSGPTMPANCAGVLAVTALNARGYKAQYANLVDGTVAQSTRRYAVAVAGGDYSQPLGSSLSDNGIMTLGYDPKHQTLGAPPSFSMIPAQGTSYSSPTVAGIAALMLAVNPALTTQDLLNTLTTSAVRSFAVFDSSTSGLQQCDASSEGTRGNCQCTQQTCGAGVVDALQAVTAASTLTGTPLDADATAYATFYTAGQGQSTSQPDSKQSGGGGGAMDATSLLALLLALIIWVVALIKGGRR